MTQDRTLQHRMAPRRGQGLTIAFVVTTLAAMRAAAQPAPPSSPDMMTLRAPFVTPAPPLPSAGGAMCRDSTPRSVGETCYRSLIQQLAGEDLPLDSLYRAAVRHRDEMLAQLAAPVRALFGDTMRVIDALRVLRSDDRFVMHDPEEILAAYRAAVPRFRDGSTGLFKSYKDVPLTVVSVPQDQAANFAPAGYGMSPDSVATLYVNAYQPGGIARMNVELGVAHEAYPGHHLQRIYNLQFGAAQPVNAQTMAFVEGWGIYAERLADEAGLYETPLSRCGYLVHLLDVFMALQLDIGVHARGWTADQAADSMMIVAGRPRVQAEQYARRHLSTAGQLASYAIGLASIVDAREVALKHGAHDVAAFHDVVLRMPMPTLPQLRALAASGEMKQPG
ncbi:MAG: DUF885 family protein [Gemmatimonadaceae bacterium]